MHVDENKKFDRRNIEKNIKNGLITFKDYETFLAGLPDANEKMYAPGETFSETGEKETTGKEEALSGRKGSKKKANKPRLK
jgi:hypothetical protein